MIHRPALHPLRMLLATLLVSLIASAARGQGIVTVSPVESITEDIQANVVIKGSYEETLTSDTTQVHLITGKAEITQGDLRFSAGRIAAFVSPSSFGFDVAIYAEDVTVRTNGAQRPSGAMAFRLETTQGPTFEVVHSTAAATNDHPLLRKAVARLYPAEADDTTMTALQAGPDLMFPPIPQAADNAAAAARRVRIRPRSNDPVRVESFTSRDTVPEERVTVITGGVNVLVDGVDEDVLGLGVSPGLVDLSADRVVIWTMAGEGDSLESGSTVIQPANARFQVYLEGNIVIRQGQNTVRATHAFFDAAAGKALLLNGELRVPILQTGGEVRARGDRIRQIGVNRFHVQSGWVTTSPYGKPGYRIQASDIFVEPGPSMFTATDPVTGHQGVKSSTWITSLNNQFIAGDVPIAYLPKISGPAEDPGIPIRSAAISSDSIFGLQVNTVWNLNKVLGIPKTPGHNFDLLGDYRSERGPGAGIRGDYKGNSGLGDYQGNGNLYYQYDNGTDNLGLDRRRLNVPDNNRGEATWRHRQELPGDALVFGEIGYLSDRNYLEQFNENRFDTDKDVETVFGLRQDLGAYSGLLWGRGDLLGFEANTQWLPRADVYAFSQPLFNGLAYWSMHSSVGYADMQRMETPADPNDPYTPAGLPYITNASGAVAMTRHELAAPFNVGPVTFEPFAMGEAAWWEEGFTSSSVDRYLMNAGLRARMTATRLFPFVRSDILGLNGLAHKHDTMLEYSYTDSSRGLNEIPQYNEIDDNAQERFRTRYTLQIFPGVIPTEFNPRNYALRSGAGLWTSAPYHEIADDFQALRLGFRDRLQTKAGPPESQRIRDWMVWEYGASFFPNADQDNFGEDFGLLYSHYRWNVSDRTSVLTDASWDLFSKSQNLWSVGLLTQRSLRGSLYLGFRQVEAKDYLQSQTFISSYSYQMSPRYISTASYAYDVAEGETRGTSLTVSRVGLDWILHFGLGFDFSKDNVGLGISLEPRFGSPNPSNMAYLLGLQ